MKANKAIKHIAGIIITMLLVSVLVFIMQANTVGDSASFMLSEEATESYIEKYRIAHNMDGNIFKRYISFLSSFFSMNWGNTLSGQPVADVIKSRLPVTISISIFSLSISLLLSVTWSILSVRKRKGIADNSLSIFSMIISSLPSFLIALIFSLVFGLWLKWFPVAGYISPFDSFLGYIRSLFLPSLTLALITMPVFMRVFREALIDNLDKVYILALKARGASRGQLILFSALKPCLPMMISLIFQNLVSCLSGSVVIESVFALPGIGSLMVKATLSRDINLASTIVMIIALCTSVLFLVSDVLSILADPRLRGGKR